MYEQLNELMMQMNAARRASDSANDKAFEARQRAIKLQFDATSAADMAALAAEMLAAAQDKHQIIKLAAASREAIRQTITLTEAAAQAVEEANALDRQVTAAFQDCRQAASRLLAVLDTVESL
ncbi:hypothetical protein [Cohnella sp. JJ-181]|uniref:hypothetical protein n=1 Tax=Cohnella rhizoplanae TaxID=2974897 RepID=UPI0022FFBE96|nr:hypothetical protein [Cohnella sp. JJ-181]CAI6082159.1 hypothetical protein COHCIP112018_03549 [Cohnella sp. JJ-181]